MEPKGDDIQAGRGAGPRDVNTGPPLTGTTALPTVPPSQRNDLRLFIACFAAIVATAFGFIVRARSSTTGRPSSA